MRCFKIILLVILFACLIFSRLLAEEVLFQYTVLDSVAFGHRKIADINQDGMNDIVAAIHFNEKSLLVWYAYPGGKKHTMVTISDFPDFPAYRSCDLELGDIDGDGDPDVVGRIGLPHPNNKDGVDCWFENPGNAAEKTDWIRHDIFPTEYAKDVEVVDLNRDGKLDVVTRSSAHKLHIHLQQKNPDTWKEIVLNIPGYDGLAAGDIDRDGDPDLVLNGFWIETPDQLTLPWTFHDFDKKWYTQHTGDAGRWFDNNTKVALADMNGDSRLDIVIAMAETRGFPLCWYAAPPNPTDSVWTAHTIGYVDCCHSLNVADFDRDGDPDVMAAELGITTAPFPVHIFLNQGNGSWSCQQLSDAGNYSATVGDLGNDGDPDIVGLRKYNQPPIEIWENLAANPDRREAISSPAPVVPGEYFLPLVVHSGDFARFDRVATLDVDLAAIQKQLDLKKRIDPDKMRLVEVNAAGEIIDPAVTFQFEKGTTDLAGSLFFLASGYTPSQTTRHFQLYFATQAPALTSLVSLEKLAEYAGQPTFKITTPHGCWFYHQTGAGFASLVDVDGNDWIGYRPEGGPTGNYRGIPNLAYDGPGEFHPGPGAGNLVSKIVHQGPLKISIYSESRDKKWACIWDIFPAYATLTLLKKGENPYWVLYEGTPGGKLDVTGDFWVNSAGDRFSVSLDWVGDLPDPEWVYFGDSRLGRVLWLLPHGDDDATDQFWQMHQEMVVFGLGREYRCCDKYLTRAPARWTFGFAENNDFTEIKKRIESVHQPFDVQVGAPRQKP